MEKNQIVLILTIGSIITGLLFLANLQEQKSFNERFQARSTIAALTETSIFAGATGRAEAFETVRSVRLTLSPK